MERNNPRSPAALRLLRLGITQRSLAEAVGLKRRAIGYQLDGVNRLRPEVVIALRAMAGPEEASEVERLAAEAWTERRSEQVSP